MITVIGAVLVPLSLIWAFNPVRLVQVALIAGIFEAAAALVFGAFGLQPAMVPGLLVLAYVVVQYALGMRYPGEGTVFSTMLPLFALLLYALLTANTLPKEFAGQIIVWPQRQDLLAPGPAPLAPTFGNVTQSLYLTIDIGLTAAVALFLTRRAVPYEKIIGAYMAGGYVVIVLVFWQLGNSVAGIPYPDDVLHSNPGWAIVSQTIGSVPRMQGPFSEPAGLAVNLSGLALCCLWLSVRGYRLMRPNLLLALAIVGVALSTSTTGIVTLVVGLPLVLALASVGGDPGALGRVGKTVGYLLLGGSLVIAPVFILKPSLADSVSLVVEATVNKGDSQSYDERTEMDGGAITALTESYGLGVGWGSYRSSSLIPGLLANSGVFGVVMVLWLGFRVWRLGKRARATSPGHGGQILVDGFSAAICGQLGSALLSAPMITSLVFYVQLGCIVGVLARMVNEPRQPSTQRPREPPTAAASAPSRTPAC